MISSNRRSSVSLLLLAAAIVQGNNNNYDDSCVSVASESSGGAMPTHCQKRKWLRRLRPDAATETQELMEAAFDYEACNVYVQDGNHSLQRQEHIFDRDRYETVPIAVIGREYGEDGNRTTTLSSVTIALNQVWSESALPLMAVEYEVAAGGQHACQVYSSVPAGEFAYLKSHCGDSNSPFADTLVTVYLPLVSMMKKSVHRQLLRQADSVSGMVMQLPSQCGDDTQRKVKTAVFSFSIPCYEKRDTCHPFPPPPVCWEDSVQLEYQDFEAAGEAENDDDAISLYSLTGWMHGTLGSSDKRSHFLGPYFDDWTSHMITNIPVQARALLVQFHVYEFNQRPALTMRIQGEFLNLGSIDSEISEPDRSWSVARSNLARKQHNQSSATIQTDNVLIRRTSNGEAKLAFRLRIPSSWWWSPPGNGGGGRLTIGWNVSVGIDNWNVTAVCAEQEEGEGFVTVSALRQRQVA